MMAIAIVSIKKKKISFALSSRQTGNKLLSLLTIYTHNVHFMDFILHCVNQVNLFTI